MCGVGCDVKMWEKFLSKSSVSCSGLNGRRKTDLIPVDSQTYIHRSVLNILEDSMSSKQKSKNVTHKQENPVPASLKPRPKKEVSCKCRPTSAGTTAEPKIEEQKCEKNKPLCPCKASSKPQDEDIEALNKVTGIGKTQESLIKVSEIQEPLSKVLSRSNKKGKNANSQLKNKEDKKKDESSVMLNKVFSRSLYTYRITDGASKFVGLSFSMRKVFKFGERGSGTKTQTGESQDFYKIRDEHLESGTLFEDPEFPATDSSLFFSQRPDRHYEWKRPGEIVHDPQLFVEGYSRFDVQQGELGDCWLLAAAANLTLYRRLFFQIVPDDQSFDDKYAGVFHFRFWQYGRWIDVVIDDRLPTYRGQLVYLHSTEENEFWSALLEKAYAKLHGSYEALKGGSTCEAMEDFTGGVTEMYEMNASPPNLFKIIIKAYERSSLMGCSIEPDPNVVEAQTPEGLIRGHAYSITRVQYVDIQTPNVSGKIPLLRLRNPWGNDSEWSGPWSDGAPEWRFITDSDKEELGLTFDHDGEFWMSFKDFQAQFNRLEICNLNPDSLTEEELADGNKKKWEMSVFEGEWVRGVTAGGCRNFLNSFWHNPQYRVTLTEVDEGDEDGNCTLIVALMQKNRRQIRRTGVELLTVGFAIYHLTYPDRVPKPLDLNFFKYNASVARSPSFINLREVSCRFKLPPGTYCIVPSTFDPNEEGEFILRVFSENKNNMEYDGSYSDYLRSHDENEVDDEDEDPQSPPSYPPPGPPSYPNPYNNPYPSSPQPASPYPSSPQPSNPYPSYPSPYTSNPYPSTPPYPSGGGGYPHYPSDPYQQNPYPQNYPQNPYPNPYQNYPSYPQPPQNPYPQPDRGRSSRSSDPITNFFNKLFK